MMSGVTKVSLTVGMLAFLAMPDLRAQGCRDYPYRDGIDPDQIALNKYVATASASVSFDDIDSVKDAREEATLEAKAEIAKFLTETIQSDSAISKIVNESGHRHHERPNATVR